MFHIVILKKIDGVIKKRYSVGYTTDPNMFHKVKKYFEEAYKDLTGDYTVTIYRLRPINDNNLEEQIDCMLKD